MRSHTAKSCKIEGDIVQNHSTHPPTVILARTIHQDGEYHPTAYDDVTHTKRTGSTTFAMQLLLLEDRVWLSPELAARDP